MQFTYPGLLWALFLLLIPLLIHLFQLRRYKKTPFTNVQLLKKVVSESRRSRSLKKWLLLFCRLLLIAALVLAFAKPFRAGPTALMNRQQLIYLDDSFSMQGQRGEGSLLEEAVQELLKAIPPEQPFTLFTNEKVFEKVRIPEIRNALLSLPYTPRQLDLEAIFLKANTYFDPSEDAVCNLVVISDFQKRMLGKPGDSIGDYQKHLVQMRPERLQNVSIDSAYLSKSTPTSLELTALLSKVGPQESVPVSLYNADTLIAKSAAVWKEDPRSQVVFTIPSGVRIDGRIEISDPGLAYDNSLYFTIDDKEKIQVLALEGLASDFLGRIYTEDEFNFSSSSLQNLNYSLLASQHLIILNQLPSIPNPLRNALLSFTENGGSLLVIPDSNADLPAYNALLEHYSATRMQEKVNGEKLITTIAFSHPLYANVFERSVTNFQFPRVSEYFPIRSGAPGLLSYQGGDPFLLGTQRMYVFSAPLEPAISNFRNSPLIVPTLYNIGSNSLQLPRLYYRVGEPATVDIPVSLGPDRMLQVNQQANVFIPLQQSYSNKTTLIFEGLPERDGHFTVTEKETPVKRLSFNYDRSESDLDYGTLEEVAANSIHPEIATLFDILEKDSQVEALWKWFVILALLCMLAELLIQKFIS